MEACVLVLDSGYQATGRTTWKKAMEWYAKGLDRAAKRIIEIVDDYPDKQVSTVNWTIRMPSVVRLLEPVNKKRAVKFSRYGVYARDGGRCQYCGQRISIDEMTYDHVVPRAQGGKTEWTNVVVCCQIDNQRKAGRTPEQAGMHLRSTPVRPKKLPTMARPMFFRDGMPSSWRSWLRDEAYWNGALDES